MIKSISSTIYRLPGDRQFLSGIFSKLGLSRLQLYSKQINIVNITIPKKREIKRMLASFILRIAVKNFTVYKYQ
ncbi:hypothetical protein [Okeania sp. KiyG1]|uniref:hypothetical protein n=1 Tax=Okeania sp. KiyG1 TaxID=2720165 RepID=UPI001923B0ED|nr:hypothetical protein [Okeania sp. KiyG1]GGA21044.1 hypothetical protein CYANOKiyG1_35990 [Okeania sp. KiyG1]